MCDLGGTPPGSGCQVSEDIARGGRLNRQTRRGRRIVRERQHWPPCEVVPWVFDQYVEMVSHGPEYDKYHLH